VESCFGAQKYMGARHNGHFSSWKIACRIVKFILQRID